MDVLCEAMTLQQIKDVIYQAVRGRRAAGPGSGLDGVYSPRLPWLSDHAVS